MKKAMVQEIIFVTGPAGAGRTTAIKSMEDFGIETIDNLPLGLIKRLLSSPPSTTTLAIGVDTRTRGFSSATLLKLIDNIKNNPDYTATLLYLDCAPETILRRFSETRRRHPASPDGSPEIGIQRDISLLSALRDRADILIETTKLSPNELRAELSRWFETPNSARLAVSVQSFSYKRGTPRGVDMMIDCRFLRNPHWEKALRPLTGRAPEVAAYLEKDPVFAPFFQKLVDLLDLLLPAYKAEGKAYFSLAMGCTGGQHRSVFVAENLAKVLEQRGWVVSLRHKEVDHWPQKGTSS